MACLHPKHEPRVIVDPTGPLGAPAESLNIENQGAMQAQSVVHVPHTRFVEYYQFTFTEVSQAVPLRSSVKHFQIREPINYIALNPSAKFNPVICRLMGEMNWVTLDGVAYPVGDFVHDGVGPTLVFRFPTMRNYAVTLCVYPPSTLYAQNSSDAVQFAYGYLPDTLERYQP